MRAAQQFSGCCIPPKVYEFLGKYALFYQEQRGIAKKAFFTGDDLAKNPVFFTQEGVEKLKLGMIPVKIVANP